MGEFPPPEEGLGLGLGLAWPCDIGAPRGWPHTWTVGERPPSGTRGGCAPSSPSTRCGVLAAARALGVAPRKIAALLALGLGLGVGLPLVGEPGSSTPRAWCFPTPGPFWQVRLEDALPLVPQLRPPSPSPLVGFWRTPSLSHRPLAAALVLQPSGSTAHAAMGAAVTTAIPQSRYQSRDYWGSAAIVLCGGSIRAAVRAAATAAVPNRCCRFSIAATVQQPGCLGAAVPLLLPAMWRTPSGGAAWQPFAAVCYSQSAAAAGPATWRTPSSGGPACSLQPAVVTTLQPQSSPSPVTNQGTIGALQLMCCSICAAARELQALQLGTVPTLLLLQLTPASLPIKGPLGCCSPCAAAVTQRPSPAPLTIKGLLGCCSSCASAVVLPLACWSLCAAGFVLWLLCCSFCAAAHGLQPLRPSCRSLRPAAASVCNL